MFTFSPIKSAGPSKVHHSEYIRTQDKPEEGAATPPKPSEPTKAEAA